MTKGVIQVTNLMKERINNINRNNFSDFVLPHISVNSNIEAIIDGCFGVVEYSDTSVRINCKTLILKFTGTELSIKTVSEQQYKVSGNILSMEFCSC